MGLLEVEEPHLALVVLVRLCVEFVLAVLVLCLSEGEGEGEGQGEGQGQVKGEGEAEGVFFGGFVQLDAILIRGFSFSKINGFVIIS